jgi:hypothetical protein
LVAEFESSADRICKWLILKARKVAHRTARVPQLAHQ